MVRTWLFTALLFCLAAPPASAQASDPVISAYRAYQAAHAAGDVAEAARQAELAYHASASRDGDGGNTPALAYNFALALMAANRSGEALAPAQRALTLAEAGAVQVDAVAARLLVGELTVRGDYQAGRLILEPAVQAASVRADLRGELFNAARALANAAQSARDWPRARDAWALAAAHPPTGSDPVLARGEALVGQGIALMYLRDMDEAGALLDEAKESLMPFRSGGQRGLTRGQYSYAAAMAWEGLHHAATTSPRRLQREAREAAAEAEAAESDGPIELIGTNLCPARRVGARLPASSYPRRQLERFGIGVVVVWVRTNAAGEVVAADPIVSVPVNDFGEAVRHRASGWYIEWEPNPPAGCTREIDGIMAPVRFLLGGG